MTIGERLEEARKRKGISIREAAEATKIRSDFLLAMENNSFDNSLPEIYSRGFLKNYATFLKLDTDQILTDYDAIRFGSRKEKRQTMPPFARREPEAGAQHSKPSFGRMDIPDAGPSSTDQTGAQTEEHDEESVDNRALYYKVGLGVVGGMVAVILLILIIGAFTGDDSPEINPELRTQVAQNSIPPAGQEAQQSGILLAALDTVLVIVSEDATGERIFEGTLSPGETRVIDPRGTFTIRYNIGKALNLRIGDRTFPMTHEGVGITKFSR